LEWPFVSIRERKFPTIGQLAHCSASLYDAFSAHRVVTKRVTPKLSVARVLAKKHLEVAVCGYCTGCATSAGASQRSWHRDDEDGLAVPSDRLSRQGWFEDTGLSTRLATSFQEDRARL